MIEIDRLCALRPFLFHLTDARNLPRIQAEEALWSADRILRRAKREDRLDRRRPDPLEVLVEGQVVRIRDQAPLHAGNIAFVEGYGMADFVRRVNGFVFFWPGRDLGPISQGVNHFRRYADQGPRILRVGTAELLAANPEVSMHVSRCNSGAPRCNKGRKQPRSDQTFVPAELAGFRASEIVEVAFPDLVHLPSRVEQSGDPAGPWRPW